MKVESRLVQRHNDKNNREEWALISKKSGRVLKWFGTRRPSDEHVQKEERRIQYFKHHGSLLSQVLGRSSAPALKPKDIFNQIEWQDNFYDLYPGYSKPKKAGVSDEDGYDNDDYKYPDKGMATQDAQEIIDFFKDLPDPIPVYRVLHAKKEEDLDLDCPGASWTWNKESALRFAPVNGLSKPWYLLSGKVPKREVDWGRTVKLHFLFSYGSPWEAENEIKVARDCGVVKDIKWERVDKKKKTASLLEAVVAAAGKVRAQDLKDAWQLLSMHLCPWGEPEQDAWLEKYKALFDQAVKKTPVKTYKIKDIEKKWQVNDHMRRVTGKPLNNPIIVANNKVVLDGNHRLISKLQNGDETVEALVLNIPWARDIEAMEGYPLDHAFIIEGSLLQTILAEKSQAAPTPDKLKKKKLYHGTDTKKAADEIWKSGIKPDLSDTPVDNVARPVAGRIYLALDLKESIPYMLGGAMAGSDIPEEWIEENGQYGYMFVVEGSALTDVQPDEDQVGQAVHDRAFPWIESYFPALRDEAPVVDDFEEDESGNIVKVEDPDPYRFHSDLLKQVDEGEYAGWIKAGHVMLPWMSDEEKYDVMRQYGNVAHLGSVQPSEMWEFDKLKSKELKADGSNLFKLARQVNKRAVAIVDPRFEDPAERQDYRDALPFEGPWNGYDQKSPIEKVYPAISRVLYPLLSAIIDPRFEEPGSGYRDDFVAPVDQTYGWGMGNGVAVEPNPMHSEASARRAFAKATLPEGSDLLNFYYLADRSGWLDEQSEEGERQFKIDSETPEEKNEIARELLEDGWNGWDKEQFKKASPEERLDAIKGYYVHKWIYDSEDENAASTETHFDNARIMSNPTLVRFTDQPPEKVLAEGFEGYEADHLGLTTHYRPAPNGTLAFAVDKKKDLKTPADWRSWSSKYGKYAYEFKVPYAVKAWHEADGEDQVVFDVTTVKNLKQVQNFK